MSDILDKCNEKAAEGVEYRTEVSESVMFEGDVSLDHLGDSVYCLSHATRHEQIFGGPILKEAFQGVNQGLLSSLPSGLLHDLSAKHFLMRAGESKGLHQERLEELVRGAALRRPSFKLLRLLLTDRCNLACSYCKVIPNVHAPRHQPLSEQRLREILEFFFANSEEFMPKIVQITGGEPLLHLKTIEQVVQSVRALSRPSENIWIVLATNGTLVTPTVATYLARYNIKCIVSLDGPAAVNDLLRRNLRHQGTFEAVDRGIKLLKTAGVEVSISSVLGRHNIDEVDQIVEFLLERYHPTGLGVNFMKPPTPGERDFEYLVDPVLYAAKIYGAHKRFREQGLFLELVYRKVAPFVEQQCRLHDCGAAAGTNLNVDSRGMIGPCKSFLVMGRLALSGLDTEEYREKVVTEWCRRSPICREECAGCPARGICGNGCAYEAFINSGDSKAVDPKNCAYSKTFHALMLEDLSEIMRRTGSLDGRHYAIAAPEHRRQLLGEVIARPNTLSYSIGHQTQEKD